MNKLGIASGIFLFLLVSFFFLREEIRSYSPFREGIVVSKFELITDGRHEQIIAIKDKEPADYMSQDYKIIEFVMEDSKLYNIVSYGDQVKIKKHNRLRKAYFF
jgi:hypothetical protein